VIEGRRGDGMAAPITASPAHRLTAGWTTNSIVQTVLWIAVCGYAAFAILSLFGSGVTEFDDAIPLVGAMQVRRGLIPGLDFYSMYPPLGFYVDAFLFGLLGRTVVAIRLFDSALYIFLLFTASRFFRRQFPHSSPIIPAATLLLATGIGGSVGIPMWPGFAFSLAAFFICLSSIDLSSPNPERTSLFAIAASGALTGISLLFRANFGAYVAAAVIIGLSLRCRAPSGRRRFEPDFKAIGAFTIPIVVCCSGFYLFVYGRNALVVIPRLLAAGGNAIAVRFIPLEFSRRMAGVLMFPALWFCFRILRDRNAGAGKALAAAGCALALPALAMAGSSHPQIPYLLVSAEVASVIFLHFFARRLEPFELSALLFYCCNLHYYLSRADWWHFTVIPIAMAILLPFAIETRSRTAIAGGISLALPALAFLAIVKLTPFRPGISTARIGIHILASAGHNMGKSDTDLVVDSTPTPDWAALYSDEDELRAVRYIRAVTSDADPIFVGDRDHSRISFNDLRFYWLADRPIGARTFQLEIGNATSADVQREIILDLQRKHVRWLAIRVSKRYDGPPGSTLLDTYIRENFKKVADFGPYAVLSASR
jgi:hypothetical protein